MIKDKKVIEKMKRQQSKEDQRAMEIAMYQYSLFTDVNIFLIENLYDHDGAYEKITEYLKKYDPRFAVGRFNLMKAIILRYRKSMSLEAILEKTTLEFDRVFKPEG